MIRIEERAKQRFPWLKLGYLTVTGLQAPKEDNARELRARTEAVVRANSELLLTRAQTLSAFYRQLGSSRASHIETLLRAVAQGRIIKAVAPVVDAVLCAELETATLMGVHDLDRITGSVLFGTPHAEESFEGISGKAVVPPRDDLVLRDEVGIWASYCCGPDARTIVHPATKNLLIFGFYTPTITDDEMISAIRLAGAYASKLGRGVANQVSIAS